LPQRLAGGHVEALESSALRRRNRSFQKNFGSEERRPRTRFNSRAVATQIDLLANLDDLDVESRARRLQDLKRGAHDFRANAVPVRDGDRCFGGHIGTPSIVALPHIAQQDLVVFFYKSSGGIPLNAGNTTIARVRKKPRYS